MSHTGAELLVDALVQAGVPQLFSLSGNQIMSVYDATIERGLKIYHTRHEAVAVHMAEGWGRATEQPGVALVTAAAGHCNAIGALYVARMSETPLVLLSGASPLNQRGKGAFQEMDQVAIAAPVCKAAWQIESVECVKGDMALALDIARFGRPGPVHLSLPEDILRDATHAITEKRSERAAPFMQQPVVGQKDVAGIIELLRKAQRPLIIVGPAMARALRWQDVARLSEVSGIPALAMESPRGMNDPALRDAGKYLAQADGVLLLGKKLDFSLRFGRVFAKECRVIQVDVEASELRASENVQTIHAEPSMAAQDLLDSAQTLSWPRSGWRDEVMAARAQMPSAWKRPEFLARTPIHPMAICAALQPFLNDDAIIVSDGGEVGQWMQGALEAQHRHINGPAGAIGGALPMALGMKVAQPHKTVFALSGDGAFGFHLMEMDTAVRHHLPVIAIVGNDARWNAEHQIQLNAFDGRTVGCDLLPSRYDKVVEALGGHGEFVQRPDELRPAIQRAIASGKPACINVLIGGDAAPVLH